MKRNKRGISLIVLVITIIVMIILAGAVIISLNSAGIIGKTNETVDATNLATVKELAIVAWAEAYVGGARTEEELEDAVTESLKDVDTSKYEIEVTDKGVTVSIKGQTTLGDLVASAADYGKTVNYVSDNGVTDWKVFYETEDYVYLIASEKLAYDKIPTTLNTTAGATIIPATTTLADNTTKTVGQVYWETESRPKSAAPIQNKAMWMAKLDDYSENINGRCVSYFLDETHWTAFKNTTASYSKYVEGAIGTPTLEMFVASWNEKREVTGDTTKYDKKLSAVVNGTTGYYLWDITTGNTTSNDTTGKVISTTDDLYIWNTASNSSIWLASPGGLFNYCLFFAAMNGNVGGASCENEFYGMRPVVCLRSNTPAEAGTTTDFSLIK